MLSTWLKRSKQTHTSTSSSTDKCNDTTAPNSNGDSTNSMRYLEATAQSKSKDAKKKNQASMPLGRKHIRGYRVRPMGMVNVKSKD